MSGIRLYSFREGDRAEYLANYLLSGLGLVTGVQRQEDIGFDFYCQLANKEKNILSFDNPFIVSIKSSSADTIQFGNSDPEKWKVEHVNWLRKLNNPLFLGFVDNKDMRIDIHCSSAIRFVFRENPNASIIKFIKRPSKYTNKIERPVRTEIMNWDKEKGDGYMYEVDLGDPIITLSNDDIYDEKILEEKKELLRKLVFMEQTNIALKHTDVPYFQWVRDIKTNMEFDSAYLFHTSKDEKALDLLLGRQYPVIISIALQLKMSGKTELLTSIIPIVKEIPPQLIPENVKKELGL